ncbi:hypothetical protein PISMIDRAFT_6495 [Pisolithus microcarpus 441]|uniref:Uncharacterized protein n=1 Tax=Pisolithus microcarpus 441 TaxID=765257 RepID=A0A0C9ZUL0_9AGAM|nr:hypothetical protein PISMIDRAFT_6495 [Pisolithus microcarpus 441]
MSSTDMQVMPGSIFDGSRTPTPTNRSTHSRTSSYQAPETSQTIQDNTDLFEDEESMVPGDCRGIPVKDSQSSESDYAETAHEGSPEPELSTSMRSTHLRHTRDESGPPMIDAPGKCRFEEIDYSHGLRRSLYEKEELVNGLKGRLRHLKSEQLKSLQEHNQDLYTKAQSEIEGQKTQIAGLEIFIQQREQEYGALQVAIHNDHEAAALRHQAEIENLRKEMKAQMDAQLEEILRTSHSNLIRELEQRDVELNAKLGRAQAEKETELASLAQQYTRRARHSSTFSETQASMPGDQSDESMATPVPVPSKLSKPTPPESMQPKRTPGAPLNPKYARPFNSKPAPTVTPNLDTIKKLRRKRGISRRTHLVSVSAEDDRNPPCEAPPEQVTPTSPEADTSMPPMPMIIEAVTNGVRSALASMFDGGQFPLNIKRSPRRRKIENKDAVAEKRAESKEERAFLLEKTRDLFKEKFGYTQDVEFIMCASADSDDVRSYQYEDSPGPDLVSPLFDLRHNAKSPWNSAIIDTLTQNLQGKCAEENWPTPRSDAYLREMIVDRYKRLRVTWKNAQPQLTDMGTLETPAETEARLLKQREQVLRETRQTTRRHSKYARRAMTLDHIIKLKTEENEDDLDAWKWLHKLIVGAYKSPLYCRS